VRLDLYGSVATSEATDQATINSRKLVSAEQTRAYKTSTEDTTTLTSSSDALKSLTQLALQPLSSRAQKVAGLREAVNSAQYQLDSAKIAEALSSSEI
jgi:anti-sigma28 factor (negative regulator of flagellin synthesis)